MRRVSLAFPLSLVFSFATACGEPDPCAELSCPEGATCDPSEGVCRCGPEGPLCGEGDSCFPERSACIAPLPEAICGPGTRWEPGERAFREATDAWGLGGVEGVRLTVTDIDGDGWPDLEVRRGGAAVDDFSTPSGRRTWLLRNTGMGSFEDVTEASGILTRRAEEPGGRPIDVVAWADVDNDGDLDVYTGLATHDWESVGFERSELLLNDGRGNFTLAGEDHPLRRSDPDITDMPAGASFVDVDLDGNIDLWLVQHNQPNGTTHADRLFLGDGRGGFTDATEALGAATESWGDLGRMNQGFAHSRAWSAAACDLNGDGYPELLAASYGRAPNLLLQARPSSEGVTFENRSVASGYAYDEDLGWETNQFARCFCQANPEAEGCDEVGAPLITCSVDNWRHEFDRQPFRLGGNSGATICADVDNDGDLDLLTTEIRHWWAGSGSDMSELLVNDGAADPAFSRPGREATGLVVEHIGASWDEGIMTAAVFDFDNDGWPDIYLGASDYPGNRGLLYHQEAPLSFRPVPVEEGIEHHRSHGIAVADFDGDGDLDVIVGHSRSRCGAPYDCYPTSQVRFFENIAGDGGNFIQLRLEGGEGTNRAAIGARVTVTAGGVTQTQEVSGGHGHYGAQNDLTLHFGLGAACEAEIEVRWPDASLTRERYSLPAGHRFVVRQGLPADAVR